MITGVKYTQPKPGGHVKNGRFKHHMNTFVHHKSKLEPFNLNLKKRYFFAPDMGLRNYELLHDSDERETRRNKKNVQQLSKVYFVQLQ